MKDSMVKWLIAIQLCTIVGQQDNNIIIINDDNDHTDVAYLFAHGLGATGIQANMYAKRFSEHPYPDSNCWILGTPLIVFNFPDAKNDNIEYHSKKVNLGQTLDMETLKGAYEQAKELLPHYGMVMFGVSRGAVTILNAVGSYQFQDLRAIIVESPFDRIKNVIKHLMHQYCLGWIPFSKNIGCAIMQKKFPAINLEGIFPIQVVRNIPKELPILLIHSRKDKVIPPDCSRRLYMELVESGHYNTYYLELASGEHARLLCDAEQKLYRNIVNAFYKRFALPHKESYARKAEHLLDYCKPTIDEVKQWSRDKRTIDIEQEEHIDYSDA